MLIKSRWNKFFSIEIHQLVQNRSKSMFLSNIFPPEILSTSIINCNLQHRYSISSSNSTSSSPSQSISLQHAVTLVQAACNMQSWLIKNFLNSTTTKPFERLNYSQFSFDDDEVTKLGNIIYDEIKLYFDTLYTTLSEGGSDLENTNPSNLENWLDILNLFILLRTWTAIERCVHYIVAFSCSHLKASSPSSKFSSSSSSSSSSHFPIDCDIHVLGKKIDEKCKLLSDYTPPNQLLSMYMSNLLSLGLLDASFKWREIRYSSSQFDEHREDIWWEELISSKIDPGGLLSQVATVLKIASEELSKEEADRIHNRDKNNGSSSNSITESITLIEKNRLTANIWMVLPAFIILIECTALTEPQVIIYSFL